MCNLFKDSANRFTLTQFYEEREIVEQAIHKGVQGRLAGSCCPPDCTGCVRIMHNLSDYITILCVIIQVFQ